MKPRLTSGTVLTAMVLCLLTYSNASPLPSRKLVPQEDPSLFTASTNLFIRDDSRIATRANQDDSNVTPITQDLANDGTASLVDKTDSSWPTYVSPKRPPRPFRQRAKRVELPALRPQPNSETEIPPTLTGAQADAVLHVLDPSTAKDQLPWNTHEAYRWSLQTKKNLILYYNHALPEDIYINAKMAELWARKVQVRARKTRTEAENALSHIRSARKRLIKGPTPDERPSLLVQAIEEGKEPWREASTWEAAEREEKWNDSHDWKWTKADLKEVLAYILAQKANTTSRRDFKLPDYILKTREEVKHIVEFEEFKRRIEPDWKWYKDDRKHKVTNNKISRRRTRLTKAGLASLTNYLIPKTTPIQQPEVPG